LECPSSDRLGFRDDFAAVVRRPLLRAAPGPIDEVRWDYDAGILTASGDAASVGQTLLLFVHQEVDESAFSLTGLANLQIERAVGSGQIWSAQATDASWELEVTF
jgi:hypothetical protein